MENISDLKTCIYKLLGKHTHTHHTQHVSKSWKSRDWSHNILMAILFLFMGLGFIYVVNPITVLMKSPFHTKSRSKHREPPFSLSLWASTNVHCNLFFNPQSQHMQFRTIQDCPMKVNHIYLLTLLKNTLLWRYLSVETYFHVIQAWTSFNFIQIIVHKPLNYCWWSYF